MFEERVSEKGFVLVTALVILAILTIMMTGLYYRAHANQKTSVSDEHSTQAFYLAEAGLNYIAWALYHDPNDSWANNDLSLDGDSTPDNNEIYTNPDQGANHTLGYFDITNAINFDPANPKGINLAALAMPPHVALDITTDAKNNPHIVEKAWNNGASKPKGNGAVVWLVPAVLNDNADPMQEPDTSSTSKSYELYAYSIGYVKGRPVRIIRARIGSMIFGFPSNLGATTNSYQ